MTGSPHNVQEQQLFRLGQMDVYCLLHGAHARVLHEHCSSMPGVPHSAQEQQLSRLGHHVYCLLHGPSVKVITFAVLLMSVNELCIAHST
mmetsp:Transcript_25391/g.68953  ORF Transcript_25391/g.68953 Transcript_25391/m.68953 type:complete len:90 (-) Transcript_25391:33-302(-)